MEHHSRGIQSSSELSALPGGFGKFWTPQLNTQKRVPGSTGQADFTDYVDFYFTNAAAFIMGDAGDL